ncbi:hypothetical protein QCD79_32665, partial [Pseudomonas quasicaspiana]|nr:hypothetical protein [Pseudomonas quasicaspiana]
ISRWVNTRVAGDVFIDQGRCRRVTVREADFVGDLGHDFLLQPEIMAEITNEVRFPNGNSAATALVDKDITSDP